MELPTEDDGTLLVSTLSGQFQGACGLKYRNPITFSLRGVRLADGKLHPPDGGTWGDNLYMTVYPKTGVESSNSTAGSFTEHCYDFKLFLIIALILLLKTCMKTKYILDIIF